MSQQKKIIAGSLMIAIFVLIVAISAWYVQNEIYFGDVCSCAIPLPIIIPVLASVGLLTGTLFYYMLSPKSEKRHVDRNAALRMLNGAERKLVKAILEHSGEVSQASLGKETGMTKVGVFRSLEKLKERGIIEKTSTGKTNSIRLSKDIMDIFE